MTVAEYIEKLKALPQDAVVLDEVSAGWWSQPDMGYLATDDCLPVMGETEVTVITGCETRPGPRGGKPRPRPVEVKFAPNEYVVLPYQEYD